MTNDHETAGLFEQVHALVSLELAGELTEVDRVRLNQLVCGNAEARRLYVQYIAETAALERYTSTSPLVAAPATGREATPGTAGSPQSHPTTASAVIFHDGPMGVLGFLGGLFESVQASPRLLGSVVLVALGTYFGVVLTTVAWTRAWNAQQLQFAAMPAPAKAGGIARLVSARNCRWQTRGLPPLEGDSLDASPLRLAAGVAEIEFADGASVVIEAPAVFTPQTAGRSLLASGRLVARVPPAAVGFTVVTPTVEVVDLGTEFGLEVDGARRTDVHVLRGEVEVKQVADSGGGSGPGVRLTAGHAVRLSGGDQITNIPIDRSRFTQTLHAGSNWSSARSTSAARTAGVPARRPVVADVLEAKGELSFVEDFSDGSPAPCLALGTGFGLPEGNFEGSFTITSAPGSRIYLRTKRADYALTNFTFEATVNLPRSSDAWSDAFFGMSPGNADVADSVGEPASPSALAVIRLDSGTASQKPELQTRDVAQLHSTTAASVVAFDDADAPSGDTQRLRMTWDAAAKEARFEVDVHYSGAPFHADYALVVDAADNGFDATNSRLILGGGYGLSFDDISVEVGSADLSQPPKAADLSQPPKAADISLPPKEEATD